MALVWYLVAWQALIGAFFFLLLVAYGSFAAHKAGKVRHQSAAITDKRLEIMKEIIAGIRVVKMYAWEWNFRDLVARLRRLVRKVYLIVRLYLIVRFWLWTFQRGKAELAIAQKNKNKWSHCYKQYCYGQKPKKKISNIKQNALFQGQRAYNSRPCLDEHETFCLSRDYPSVDTYVPFVSSPLVLHDETKKHQKNYSDIVVL